MTWRIPLDVPAAVRGMFRRHLGAECLICLAVGVLSLSEAVLRKSLGASDWQVTLQSMALNVPSLLGGFWGLWLEGKNKRPVFLACGVLRYLGLIALVMRPDPAWFLGVFMITAWMEPCFQTAQSSLLQSNYPTEVRGKMLSWVSAIGRITLLLGALAGGALLDHWPGRGPWILAGGGAFGFLGAWLYAAIPFTNPRTAAEPARSWWRLLARSFGDLRQILRENPAFARYERNYFLYGMAFMMLLPVNVWLLIDAFQVTYKEFSLIKLVMLTVGFMLSIPFWGHAMDRRGPYGTAALAFLALTLFPGLLSGAVWLHAPWVLWTAFLVFGVCMAGVHVTWTLSSVTFARGRDSTPFMGIHIFCVGVRGVCGPLIGLGLYQFGGYHAAFGVSCALFLIAGLCMQFSPDRRAVEGWGE